MSTVHQQQYLNTVYTAIHGSSVGCLLADSQQNYHVLLCIVLRYCCWWTVDMSETCRVLYQINLRNNTSRCLSL